MAAHPAVAAVRLPSPSLRPGKADAVLAADATVAVDATVAIVDTFRTIADPVIDIKELAAMAHQPVVMQREKDRNPTLGERLNDRRGQAGQMMDVRNVWFEVIDRAVRDRADCVVSIRLLKRPRIAKRVVHRDDAHAITFLGPNVIFNALGILFAREDKDFIAARPQRTRVRTRVQLGAALRGRRKSVDDLKDPHQTILDRIGFQPLTADSAPRYCPSGQANANAMARPLRANDFPSAC